MGYDQTYMDPQSLLYEKKSKGKILPIILNL
jgi:hypothetical protein